MIDAWDIYQSIYADPAHHQYGRGLFRCRDFLPRIWNARLYSVMSFGCGHGDELFALAAAIPYVMGIDIALPEQIFCTNGRSIVRVKEDITKMEYRTKWMQIDAVVSFDVLEHIQEAEIDSVLRTARRIAPRAFFAIANMRDVHQLPDGREVDLHLIQEPPMWWVRRIVDATGWKCEIQNLQYPERFGIWCGDWA